MQQFSYLPLTRDLKVFRSFSCSSSRSSFDRVKREWMQLRHHRNGKYQLNNNSKSRGLLAKGADTMQMLDSIGPVR
jgi:hypothetical protein